MWASAITAVLQFISRVWDFIAERTSMKTRLTKRRKVLEQESIEAQIKGNLSDLRRISNEIEDIDRQLQSA